MVFGLLLIFTLCCCKLLEASWSDYGGLPSIYVESNKMSLGTSVDVFLFNVPNHLIERQQVLVSCWQLTSDSSSPFHLVLNMDVGSFKYELEPVTSNLHLSNLKLSAVFTPLNFDVTLRYVVQFKAINQSVEPSPYCTVPSFCYEAMFFATWDRNHFRYTTAVNDEALNNVGLKMQHFIQHVNASIDYALRNMSVLPAELVERRGLSGVQFRVFMNNLGSWAGGLRYLEVGVFSGSTLFSMLYNNMIHAVAIDKWSDPILGANDKMKAEVLASLEFIQGDNTVTVIDKDCFEVVKTEEGRNQIISGLGGQKANVYFYDAGHREIDHFMGLINFYDVLDDNIFVYIVDDWNVERVRTSTHAAIAVLSLIELYKFELFTAGNDDAQPTLWHNGVVVYVFAKPQFLSNVDVVESLH